MVNVHALIATGINADGYREILGVDVSTAEDGAGWLTFWRSLTARGPQGSSWSPAMPMPAWSPRSGQRCPGRPGSAAERTTRPT